jgi:DNA invertase Pin-like site-specific DNA recombinase
MGQVRNNQESQRRQYGLEQNAHELGFQDVEIIDDDLGRSGSGLVERPGFQRLVAEVCSGEVGAVFCIEASRLARNGRDWHHLMEMCGLVGSVIVDPDGIYDPCITNDRLLLGLKGTMNEFELNILRQRSLEALKQKAQRGELQFKLPVGYSWTRQKEIHMDPDLRIQQAIKSVFAKMVDLGSVRQVLLWFRNQKISLPIYSDDESAESTIWKLPSYNTVHRILTNPVYAGAYAYGKTCSRTIIVNGRARKTRGHKKPRSEWEVLIFDHHEGYISWDQFERNQAMIAKNTFMTSKMEPKSGRGGQALLSGLLRCKRCGRMLHVAYSGKRTEYIRYHCRGANVNHGEVRCISFGGLRVDKEVSNEILRFIGGNAVEAALAATEQMREKKLLERRSLELESEQAQYESRLAARRYEAVDPDNRLVASELEARWNQSLQKVQAIKKRLENFDKEVEGPAIPDQALLLHLADDFSNVWHSPSTDMGLKQRIVGILIQEMVVDIDEEKQEIVLIVHWSGHRHSQLRIKKNKTGRHSRCTSEEAVDIVRHMAGRFTDEQIAATLNRLKLRTGAGNTWNERRVCSLRHHQKLPIYQQESVQYATMQEAADRLNVSPTTIRRLIMLDIIPGEQVVPCAPWRIPIAELGQEAVLKAVHAIKSQKLPPHKQPSEGQLPLFSDT